MTDSRRGIRKPNILFVFADQMSAHHMGCSGTPGILTPNLDCLAGEGVFCTRHISNCPICSPNRATMFTGTYPTTHRLIFNDTQVRTDLPTLATVARDHGYRTGYIGKWHMDAAPREAWIPPGPRRLGFDDFWAVYNCHHDYFDPKYYLGDSPDLVRRSGYEPEVQTDLALEFLDGQKPSDPPFLLAVSYGPPHNSYELVPRRYQDLYDPARIEFRPNCRDIPRESLDPAWEQRTTTRDFYALVTSLDAMMGRLLARLNERGLADDTIVVFTSDHGDMLWSQGLLYKCVPFEESVGIPLLIRYPRLLASRRVDAPIGSVDLLATLAGLAGWSVPATDGTDCSALLAGAPGAPGPESALIAMYNPYLFRRDFPVPEWRGLRTRRYTYTETVDRRPWLVFDNEADPYQLNNRAADPGLAGIRTELAAQLRKRLEALGDPFLDQRGMMRQFGVKAGWQF